MAVLDKDDDILYNDAYLNNPNSNDKLLINKVFGHENCNNGDHCNEKYDCGFMAIRLNAAVSGSINLYDENEECKGVYDLMDRGWYKRVHHYCKHDKIYEVPTYHDRNLCKLNGFGVVLSYGITCGFSWVLASIITALAFFMNNKIFGFISIGFFSIIYIIFIGLFSAGWNSVRNFNQKCLDFFCKEDRKSVV